MTLLCELAIKSEGTRFRLNTLDNKNNYQAVIIFLIFFFTEKLKHL